MIIEEKDFRIIPISDDSPFFDLELLYVIKSRNGENRLEFKNSGYGLPLGSALRKVAHYKVACKHRDEAIKLKTYVEEYKQATQELLDLLEEKNNES